MTSSDVKLRSWWQVIKSCSGAKLDRRNQNRFAGWMLVWAVSYAAASWTLKADLDLATPLAWFLVAEAAGAPQLETDHIIVVMIFSWTIGQLLGIWRFR